MHTQTISTNHRQQMLDITDTIQSLITKEKITEGLAIVFVPHTTAAVTINENADPDVQHDLLLKLARLIPKEETGYNHSEGNSDSHLKSALVGNTATIIIENGRLHLGQWQGIFFCEFDGPRERHFNIKLVNFAPTSTAKPAERT